jgi:methionine-rich copper-binding protein CopC
MGFQEQALYPARAGMQAILQMTLKAPLDVGRYTSTWQAVAPDGNLFGEVVTITIIVQQP